MNLSNLLYGFEVVGRGWAPETAPAPAMSVGAVTVALAGAANDLSVAHNDDDGYRPHLVERREARRRRREIRTA